MSKPFLRLADAQELDPIDDDETAKAEINKLWLAARTEFSNLLGIMSPRSLRWLITGPTSAPTGGIRRAHLKGMATSAREIAASATKLADHLQRAADVFDRREGRNR